MLELSDGKIAELSFFLDTDTVFPPVLRSQSMVPATPEGGPTDMQKSSVRER